MVLLDRDTVNDSIHGWESQTPGLLETAEQVTSQTAIFEHVFVELRDHTLGEPLYGGSISYNNAKKDPSFQ